MVNKSVNYFFSKRSFRKKRHYRGKSKSIWSIRWVKSKNDITHYYSNYRAALRLGKPKKDS